MRARRSAPEQLFVTYMVSPHVVLEVFPNGTTVERYNTTDAKLFSKWVALLSHDCGPAPTVLAWLGAWANCVQHVRSGRCGGAGCDLNNAVLPCACRFEEHDVHGGPPVVHVPGSASPNGKPYYLGIMHHIEK